MRENVVKTKSLDFAIRIVQLNHVLISDKKEIVMSKQVLRSGTSVGAMIREAEHAESKPDFIHKMAIAQKEINETLYWLELLFKTDYLNQQEYNSLSIDATELLKLLTSIIKATKANINNSPLTPNN
ncbi:four helix bundle protein [Arenibacter algicola]|jgi:four helix bundle protein|uniref:Four helix bundle protein n=1 Tax=Arenibacter algicola TaxID=616991 RepID=A0A221V2A3_9FLAO|nr:four helix bundle protein [Arenibacter algicola]ASO07516.1 four helix bundle protein [Arenibacter algicola]|tara:strand:- start:40504 stop:40884 length:381 start_codon:yes stop_codon:yes gene_type:complete